VADSTIDATVSADRLATEINDGRGNSAQGSCEELLGIFNGALNQLSTDAKSSLILPLMLSMLMLVHDLLTSIHGRCPTW